MAPPLPPQALVALGLIVVATIVVYARVASFGFIERYDDRIYVTGNAHVTSGLSADNVHWAFTQPVAGNWHPLTMLSHMTDVSLFGVKAGPHHVVNLVFHVVNTLLLFYVLVLATRRPWPSLFVTGLFALHPMHVESVAWIAERKDVLSTFFWLLTMAAYVLYVRRRSIGLYALATAFLVLGLMAKPMLVTLPLVLVLMDRWPLQRIGAPAPASGKHARKSFTWLDSIVEKIPMFLAVAIVVIVTILTQRQIGAVSNLEQTPPPLRLANILDAYLMYVVRLFVPVGMAVFYPHRTSIDPFTTLAAIVVLGGITAALFPIRGRAPYAWFGWLWFVGTLVPVIGIVEVGSQAMADRYTYVPYIGLGIALAWAAADLSDRAKLPRGVTAGVAGAVLAIWSWLTFAQVGTWQDSFHLFRHALDVTHGNFIADNNYGAELLERNDVAGAGRHFAAAVAASPSYETAWLNLGLTYQVQRKLPESQRALERAVALDPQDGNAEYRLAVTLALQQQYAEATPHYEAALRLMPEASDVALSYSNALNNYGLMLATRGRAAEAAQSFERALQLRPENEFARRNLAELKGTPPTR